MSVGEVFVGIACLLLAIEIIYVVGMFVQAWWLERKR